VILAVHHSLDGKRLASAGGDGTLRLWDLAGGEGRIVLRRPGAISCVRFSPDGKRLIAATSAQAGTGTGEVLLCDLEGEGEPIRFGEPGSDVRAVRFSPDGRRLSALRLNGLIQVWDAASRRELLHFPAHSHGAALDYSPDGRRLASSGLDGAVRLWEADTGQEVLRLEAPEHPGGTIGFSPDGRWLATGGGGSQIGIKTGEVRLWDAGWPEPVKRLAGEDRPFTAVWFTPDGKRLMARDDGAQVKAWSLPEVQPVESGDVKTPVHAGRLALSPIAGFQAAVHPEGTIQLVDLRPQTEDLAERRALALTNRDWHEPRALQAQFHRSGYSWAFHARGALRGDVTDAELLPTALYAQQKMVEEFGRRGDIRVGAARRELRSLAETLVALLPEDNGVRFQLVAVLFDSTWTPLSPAQVDSTGGATLTVQPDGSVLASGTNPDEDSYTLTFRAPVSGITGLRLEALPDPSLKGRGPGRAPENGNFELGEVRLTVAPVGGAEKAVSLTTAAASYNAPASKHYFKKDMRPEWAIDGDPKTCWNPFPALGVAQWLLVQTAEPVGKAGDVLTVRLDFHTGQPRHALGRFRLAVTTDPRPALVARWKPTLARRRASSWTLLALAAWFEGDWPAVVSACEKARGLSKDDSALDAALLALAQGRKGERTKGRPILERARQLAGAAPDALLAELMQEAEAVYRH
jgi:hypothetical protein